MSTHPTFGPGRLSEDFLSTKPDPWILETTAPDDEGHRDAFLGNGWVGQRFGVEGDASCFPARPSQGPSTPSGCLIHGLWNDVGLIDPPLWAVLGYHDGERAFARGVGTWREYRQRLDLRTATLTTELTWDSGQRTSRIVTRAWLSRTRPGVAVIEREVTPSSDGAIRFSDMLDGRVAGSSRAWVARGGVGLEETISLDARLGPRERRVAMHSRVLVEGAAPRITVELDQNDQRSIQRTIHVDVRAGQPVRVTKVVAIATDAESDGPWTAAWNLVEGAARGIARLRAEHEAAWAELWKSRIEVEHPAVQQILNATLYQMYCHLRAGSSWVPGPAGLSANAWGGHVFWDDDLRMFPGVCLLRPELGKCFAEYRHRTLAGAVRNAVAEGYDGAMIAWESAEFGDDTIPHLIYHHQHHVNSDVALTQWWYALIAGDEAYLREKGADVILQSARFWADFAVFNAEEDRYEIRLVCCADEIAGIRDNNAYTSYSAAWTLRLATRVAKRFGRACPKEWEVIADKIWIPFDDAAQRFIEYEGYAGETIKQAGAALLVYPYEMPMPDAVKANTVDYYRQRYPEGNIMMAAAFDGIVDCELGRAGSGWDSFKKLLPHFREPYLLPSESPLNECVSFATGLGGLLQLVMMGFAGIRVRDECLSVTPCVPDELGTVAVRGLHYGGVSFDLVMCGGEATVENAAGEVRVEIGRKQQEG
jgi:trehalose/maltose hydrolase-like predicted phosphorylase